MTGERLFDIDSVPEVPLLREPRASRGAAVMDERLAHDYPPEWHRCTTCRGTGDFAVDHSPGDAFGVERGRASIACSPGQGGNWARVTHRETGLTAESDMFESGLANVEAALAMLRPALRARGYVCPDCLGMGSVKAMTRLLAGHRCERCGHPYMPKGDAAKLGVEASGVGGDHMGGRWSACDGRCTHGGPIRYRFGDYPWTTDGMVAFYGWADVPGYADTRLRLEGAEVEAEWRILTVHHLDGDKANLSWWNLAALCQRCHLQIQARVVLERVYPHEHTDWFRPHAAGYYAKAYLGLDLTRDETLARLDELLALELAA